MLDLPLPEDLTREILLRIPFESLLACKLVSKRWKNVINDPKFYSRYRNKSMAFYFGKQGVYCLLTRYNVKLRSNDPFPSYTVHRIPMGLNDKSTQFDLLPGLSNGIACVSEFNGCGPFQLFNLFTGASYTVEISPSMIQQRTLKCSMWGFGYDVYTDDYKIFRRYHYSNKFSTTVANDDEFWIYSFKDESWKQVNGFPEYYWPSFVGQACSLNGALHWVAVARHTKKRVVVTYDLHSGMFGEVLLPTESCNSGDGFSTGKLSVLNGQLCFVYQIGVRDDFSFCVWMMNDYGVKESWTKLLALNHLTLDSSHWRMIDQAIPVVLYEHEDGRKVVLFSRTSPRLLFWYDLDNCDTQETNIYTICDLPLLLKLDYFVVFLIGLVNFLYIITKVGFFG